MFSFTTKIMITGAVGLICAHVASERGWTDEWSTVQYRKKRTPSSRKVVVTSTENCDYSSDCCDSAVAMSDSGDSSDSTISEESSEPIIDIEVPDSKKCTSANNSFACLDYFLDWDEAPDDFDIHLAGTDFIDQKDPYLRDT